METGWRYRAGFHIIYEQDKRLHCMQTMPGLVTKRMKQKGALMIYKTFQDIQLSGLGLGAMRLPVIDGDDARIDEAAAIAMIDEAYRSGVNYYDTAWGYHNGTSELVVGKALHSYPRETFYLADKFPGYDLHNFGKTKEIFEKQLEKCQVEYFDFYLFHNVCELNIGHYLDEETYGTYQYLMEQKRNGRIRHLGFSCHGDMEVLKAFVDRFGDDMEFCQLQLNWLDWTFQNDKEKVEYLRECGIPIWVMEPLRGGRLAKLAEKDEAALKALRPEEGIPAWSFRFLQSLPEVGVTLSGMSNMEQLKDNLATWQTDRPLNEEEMNTILTIAQEMTSAGLVPCTQCHYCTSHCPKGIDIPHLIELYNEHKFTEGGFLAPMGLMAVDQDKQPESCVACHSCEAVCPQGIKIADVLKDFVHILGRS